MLSRTIMPCFYLFAGNRHLLLQVSKESASLQSVLLALLPNQHSVILLLCVSLAASLLAACGIILVNARRNIALRRTQEDQIRQLKQEISRCTRELDTQRQTLASNFHDETGNLLSVIIHQSTLLKLKAGQDVQPIVENILDSSQQLYHSSKHLLWNLNNNSEDPRILFEYLVNVGQAFCNKFDLAFSAEQGLACIPSAVRLHPAAPLNILFMVKEAMSNVARHAGATEVVLNMTQHPEHLSLELRDDGRWKEPDPATHHYGLSGIEERCRRNGFTYQLIHSERGTTVQFRVPVKLS